MTEIITPGIARVLTAETAYALPDGPHRLLAGANNITYSTTVDGTFNPVTNEDSEPGILVDGGFIKTSGVTVPTRTVITKKISMLSTYASKVARSNPTSLWRFNESLGTTILDYMGNYNLTAGAAIALAQTGPTGDGSTAALMDGTTNSDAVGAAVNPWSGGTAISFEAWINNAAWSASHEVIVSLGSTGLYMSIDGGRVFMSIFLAAQFTNFMIAPGNPVALDSWSHVAATWETGDQLRLFLNGKEATSYNNTTARSGTLTASSGIAVGSFAGGSLFWSGKLADVAFYLRKLSANEIFEHAQAKNNRT